MTECIEKDNPVHQLL